MGASRALWFGVLGVTLALNSIGCATPMAGAAGAAGAAGGAGGYTGLMGSLCNNLKLCKAKFCASPCGKLFSQGMAPLKCLTGGEFGNCCPTTPTPAQMSQPGAAGAAAQIQADTAAAKERVAAVEYLGTVDCHYWPEAEKTLIDSLRADRNECVRFAAARVLGSGCCCTAKTVAALTLTASGGNSDGNPSENSLRVRAAAAEALAHCSSAPIESIPPQPPERPEPVPPEVPSPALPDVPPAIGSRSDQYYNRADQMPRETLLAQAREAMDTVARLVETPGAPPLKSQSLFDIAASAQGTSRRSSPGTATEAPALVLEPLPMTPASSPTVSAPAPESPKTSAEPVFRAAATTVRPRPKPVPKPPTTTPGTARTLSELFSQSTSSR